MEVGKLRGSDIKVTDKELTGVNTAKSKERAGPWQKEQNVQSPQSRQRNNTLKKLTGRAMEKGKDRGPLSNPQDSHGRGN